MRCATVHSFLFLAACTALLAYSWLPASGVEKPNKPLLVPQLVSPKRADADSPRFVVAARELSLLWRESKGETVDLSITAIDPAAKRLGPTRKALTAERPGVISILGAYTAITVAATPPTDGSPPAFLLAYADTPYRPAVGNRPDYHIARLVPDGKKETYRTEKSGQFLPRGVDTGSFGGRISPGQISLLRRASNQSPLYLVGSNYTQTWSIASSDGGKTWSAPHVITKNESHAHVVETSAEELLLFSSALTPMSRGRYGEIHLRRSKDGKTWSDAQVAIRGCSSLDRKR